MAVIKFRECAFAEAKIPLLGSMADVKGVEDIPNKKLYY
jgi:hypothetical protein